MDICEDFEVKCYSNGNEICHLNFSVYMHNQLDFKMKCSFILMKKHTRLK